MSPDRLVGSQQSQRGLVEEGVPVRYAISGHLAMTIHVRPGEPMGSQPSRGVVGASPQVTRAPCRCSRRPQSSAGL